MPELGSPQPCRKVPVPVRRVRAKGNLGISLVADVVPRSCLVALMISGMKCGSGGVGALVIQAPFHPYRMAPRCAQPVRPCFRPVFQSFSTETSARSGWGTITPRHLGK
jgi:hypothetical protein